MPQPNYQIQFYVDLPFPREAVFELFTDLTQIHLWNIGMLPVEGATRMVAGLTYTAKNVTAGRLAQSQVTIDSVNTGNRIEMHTSGSVLSYEAEINFSDVEPNSTRIMTQMTFTLTAGLLPDALAVAEEMAIARIKANLEMMATMLAAAKPTT